MANKRDFYEVLGVSKSSTDKEIKKAFKLLAKKYHPDISKEDDAENKFKEIQEAYAILSDATKKQQYDQYGHAAFDQMSGGGGAQGFDFSDIFSEIFGGGFGGFGGGFNSQRQSNPNSPRQGRDMEMNVQLTFKEAVFGTKKEIKVQREVDCSSCHGVGAEKSSDVVTCPTCGGQGRVQRQQQTMFGVTMTESVCPACNGQGKTIKNKCKKCHGNGRETVEKKITVNFPAGVETGSYMRVPGKGEGGSKGGHDGDLFLNVYVTEDAFFKRRGNDIHVEIPINYSQAVLGATIGVPTIHGDISLKIPSGTQTGSTLRIKGKGVHGSRHGNQYVTVNIQVPKDISAKAKGIIKELGQIEEEEHNNGSFFDNIKSIFNKN